MSDKLMDVSLVWFGIFLWALKELTMDSEKNRENTPPPTSNEAPPFCEWFALLVWCAFLSRRNTWIWCRRAKETGLPLKTIILLMVQKSEKQPPIGCIKPCKWWDKLPTSTGAGSLSHQQFHLKMLPLFEWFCFSILSGVAGLLHRDMLERKRNSLVTSKTHSGSTRSHRWYQMMQQW